MERRRAWLARAGRWLAGSGAPDAPRAVTKPCPRCGAAVEVPVFGARGFARRWAAIAEFPPTVAWVVRSCGCARLGVPALPAWRQRARRPFASW